MKTRKFIFLLLIISLLMTLIACTNASEKLPEATENETNQDVDLGDLLRYQNQTFRRVNNSLTRKTQPLSDTYLFTIESVLDKEDLTQYSPGKATKVPINTKVYQLTEDILYTKIDQSLQFYLLESEIENAIDHFMVFSDKVYQAEVSRIKEFNDEYSAITLSHEDVYSVIDEDFLASPSWKSLKDYTLPPNHIFPKPGDLYLSSEDMHYLPTELPEDIHVRFQELRVSTYEERVDYEMFITDTEDHFITIYDDSEANYSSSPVPIIKPVSVDGKVIDASIIIGKYYTFLTEIDHKLYIKQFDDDGYPSKNILLLDHTDGISDIHLLEYTDDAFRLLYKKDNTLFVNHYNISTSLNDQNELDTIITLKTTSYIKETVDAIKFTRNHLAITFDRLYDGHPQKVLGIYDYGFNLKYLYTLPLGSVFENIVMGDYQTYDLYFKKGDHLVRYQMPVNENRLADVVLSYDWFGLIVNGNKSDMTFIDASRPYKFWYNNFDLYLGSSCQEVWFQYTNNLLPFNDVKYIEAIGDKFIGLNDHQQVRFVAPLQDSFHPLINSPLRNEIFGKSIAIFDSPTPKEDELYYLNLDTYSFHHFIGGQSEQMASITSQEMIENIDDYKKSSGYALNTSYKNDNIYLTYKNQMLILDPKTNLETFITAPSTIVRDDSNQSFTFGQDNVHYFDHKTNAFTLHKYPYEARNGDTIWLNNQAIIHETELLYVPDDYETYKAKYYKYSLGNGETLSIIDNIDYHDHHFMLTYKSQDIVRVETEGVHETIIPGPVRDYEITEHGIVYTKYDQEAFAYLYDFNTRKSIRFETKHYVREFSCSDDKIAITDGDELVIYSLEDMHEIQRKNVRDLSLKLDTSFDVEYKLLYGRFNDQDYLVVEYDLLDKLLIIDPVTMHVLHELDGNHIELSPDGKLVFLNTAYVLSYDLVNHNLIPIMNVAFPYSSSLLCNQVVVETAFDHSGSIEFIDLDNVDSIVDDSVDLFIIIGDYFFSQHMYIYDRINQQFDILAYGVDFEYDILDTSIKYRVFGQDYTNDWSEWKEYQIHSPFSYQIIDERHD